MGAVVITGAGSGIGAAVARKIAGPGVCLVLHSRAGDTAGAGRLAEVAHACAQAGAAVETRGGDIGAAGEAAALVARARDRFGRIDALVHAAGFADKRPARELTRADFDRSLSTMPAAFLELVGAAWDDLAGAPGGRVVAVSSFVAHRFKPDPAFPASAAAKAALEALVRSFAASLADTGGATVNAVIPGFTRKDAGRVGALGAAAWDTAARQNPQKRLAEPAEIADAVLFFLSPGAGHVTGALLPVDGGLVLG